MKKFYFLAALVAGTALTSCTSEDDLALSPPEVNVEDSYAPIVFSSLKNNITRGDITGKAADPAAEFSFCPRYYRGKNVILVDDVVTRGRTLSGTGNRILPGGAASVVGLVVARTINPDWAA